MVHFKNRFIIVLHLFTVCKETDLMVDWDLFDGFQHDGVDQQESAFPDIAGGRSETGAQFLVQGIDDQTGGFLKQQNQTIFKIRNESHWQC